MNWGKKLILGMSVFILFILVLSFIMISSSNNDALVETDYYEKGQSYNEEYNAKQNAIKDRVLPIVSPDSSAIRITFPAAVRYRLLCRRASDAGLDTTFSGQLAAEQALILDKSALRSGPWTFRIDYTVNNRDYLFIQEVKMP
jgi:hypothetical protein